ncbi:microneme protein MIC8 [Besnoitia besnoiti]|uniref:Microneme protein MIC8 n=1 Tax=Besnoitia besnoiti TaxID=94643 RepID=A0A2A9MPQ8_BESBE|nr:microneme protein MIC8 [Besnoitia besnoiti]PFH38356.1 microneme protein MIC8 [Besnoitia besnoiti]
MKARNACCSVALYMVLAAFLRRETRDLSVSALRQQDSQTALLGEDDDPSEPEDPNSWICRISKGFDACGSRGYAGLDGMTGTYCPDGFCCSKTACFGTCGSWCHDNWALCSSSVVYHPEYSYGNCNCKRMQEKCHANAGCVHVNRDNGGAYCKCNDGYWGDGKTCKIDFCRFNPCGEGTCIRTDDAYKCECPPTHKLVGEEGKQTCQEKPNFCLAEPCGPASMVEKCVNHDETYECICKQGYEVRNRRCEEVDLCADSPCGPAEAVHQCVTEKLPRLIYRCTCKAGYDLITLPDGISEKCVKNWCYDEPCGSRERVKSCSSKAHGYSCLCKEGAEVEVVEGNEKCVKADLCRNDPCGPQEAVAQCYTQGSTYKCLCNTGYTEVPVNGKNTCQRGDPCTLNMCGGSEAVQECTTDGLSYACTCMPGYSIAIKHGKKVCVHENECAAHCGSAAAVKTCEVLDDGTYQCTCNPGYVMRYRGEEKSCVHGDPCSLNPCGAVEAVRSCTVDGDSYDCECNTGFVRRRLPDGKPICADPASCVGNPCGSSDSVEACIAGTTGYTCRCKEGYTAQSVATQLQCIPEVSAGGSHGSEESKEENTSGASNLTIAGGVIGGLVLFGLAAGGLIYARNKRGSGDDDEDALPPRASAPFVQGPAAMDEHTWAPSISMAPAPAGMVSPHPPGAALHGGRRVSGAQWG